MKLWAKGYELDSLVEDFMAGDDPYLDEALIVYDCLGSLAHAKMLQKIGILTANDLQQLQAGLKTIIELANQRKFVIQKDEEDVHTAVENTLIKQLGDLGKKLHTARSRNDQVLLDIRLYARDWLLEISEAALSCATVFCYFAEKYKDVPIPGRTHFQKAMPSSLGLWAGAFAESLLDDISLIQSTYELINQCPLGSAASYGVSLPIDRQYCADLLGFRAVQNNVLYANNSRGKFESIILGNLVQIMNDCSKLAVDMIIFSAPEFNYIQLPEKFCPGSSLMPQKRNPCPLELIRAKSATVQGFLFQTLEIIRSLPSGYNRDFQETKRPLMQGFEVTFQSLNVMGRIFSELKVNQKASLSAFTPDLFATDDVLDLVQQGIPFRDAYKQVAMNSTNILERDPVENIRSKTHQGATGNLVINQSLDKIQIYLNWVHETKGHWKKKREELLRAN